MDPTGFGLAIIGEARTLAVSIKNRIENFRNGPAAFRNLSNNVDCLAEQIVEVENVLRKFPNAVPTDISVIFDQTFSRVRDILEDSNSTMERSFSGAFAGSSSSAIGKLKSKANRTFRATALSTEMAVIERRIEKASNQLLQLTLALGNSLKMQQHHDIIPAKFESMSVSADAKDVFRPWSNASALMGTVHLEFDTSDASGRPITPEGILKRSVLSSDSSSTVTAAAGVMQSAFGVVGMAGVGKTIALHGLAFDKDIRRRFPDGILFMTLGQGATMRAVIGELRKILILTGGSTIAANVLSCTSLRDAVDYATPWFEKRVCLFLLDDVWPTSNCKTGFLTDLLQLLRNSPESRIAISTRNVVIAHSAGSIVQFGARDPLGTVSLRIFMSHSTSTHPQSSAYQDQEVSNSVRRILSICNGLPIALAVAGCAAGFLTKTYGDFESACDAYATQLEKKTDGLGDEHTMEGKSLNAGILLSLEYLQVQFLKWKTENSLDVDLSIIDIYTSLSVLENQAWIPVSLLDRLWQIGEDAALNVVNLFCVMSLATLHVRRSSLDSSDEAGIMLHDLQLDFCRRQALKTKKLSLWHAQLLNGYVNMSRLPRPTKSKIPVAQAILRAAPRPWWSESVPKDGYIHAKLSRHLACAGHGIELAALLLDARWTDLRGRIGGILALKTDFVQLENFLAEFSRELENLSLEKRLMQQAKDVALAFGGLILGLRVNWFEDSGAEGMLVGQVRQSFAQIFKAVELSWGRKVQGQRAFQFQVCGRLMSVKESSAIVETYLKSVERNTPKPYMLPVSPFFQDLSKSVLSEIRVGRKSYCVACSPCGRYFAVGAGKDIVVAKPSTGEILQRIQGHSHDVRSIAFAEASKKIVAGAKDGIILVWEWESSAWPVRVLEGHDYSVTGIVVNDGKERILSGSNDGTVKIWDSAIGAQVGQLAKRSDVNSIAICPEGLKVAFGLDTGTLKVLNIVTRDVLLVRAKAHTRSIDCVSFSPNGLYIATGSNDKTACVWKIEAWSREGDRFAGHADSVTDVAFSHDEKRVVSSSVDCTIRLWDVESGLCAGISPTMTSAVESISFSSNGDRIISGSRDGVVRIWNASLGTELGKQTYIPFVNCISISPNGLRVAITVPRSEAVRQWDSRTGEEICGSRVDGRCASFSSDGRWLVVGKANGSISLWDTETYAQIRNGASEACFNCVSISFDGRRILSGSFDGTVRIWALWRTTRLEQIGEAIQGHREPVECVSESCDGCYIVSRGQSGRTFIWNRENRSIIWRSGNPKKARGAMALQKEIADDEAERIIRSCCQQTPYLWPQAFPAYTGEVYGEEGIIYTNLVDKKTLLADIPPHGDWTYNAERKLFAAFLRTGSLAICKLVTE